MTDNTADTVLDASVLLAFLYREPGWEVVNVLLDSGVVSAVNLAEVVSKLIDGGMAPQQASEAAMALNCQVVAVDQTLGLRMGTLHRQTRGRNISLGDRACLALGERLGLPIVTADRAWSTLDLGLEIRLLR